MHFFSLFEVGCGGTCIWSYYSGDSQFLWAQDQPALHSAFQTSQRDPVSKKEKDNFTSQSRLIVVLNKNLWETCYEQKGQWNTFQLYILRVMDVVTYRKTTKGNLFWDNWIFSSLGFSVVGGFDFVFLRQDFTMLLWLSWNIFSRPGWPPQRSTCHHLPSAGISGVSHPIWLPLRVFKTEKEVD